jgi:hypothetical protein
MGHQRERVRASGAVRVELAGLDDVIASVPVLNTQIRLEAACRV